MVKPTLASRISKGLNKSANVFAITNKTIIGAQKLPKELKK